MGVAAGILFAMSAASADAVAPSQAGWWSALNQGSPAAGAPAAAPPIDPDVPEGGLLVQGGETAETPAAFAALSFDLEPGATASKLVLAVAPNSGTTPAAVPRLCRLTVPSFNAADGGPMSEAPGYDCSGAVEGSASSDGTSYSFDVGGLVGEGSLVVAVLPSTATDRVVFAAPGPDSLDATAGTDEPPPEVDGTEDEEPPPAAGPAEPPVDTGTTPTAPGFTSGSPPVTDPPVDVPSAAPAPVTDGSGAAQPVVPVASSGAGGDGFPYEVLALAGVAAVVGCWSFASRSAAQRPPPVADGRPEPA